MNYKSINDINDVKITNEYIPYIQKVSECKNIADVTSHKTIAGKKVFIADSTTRHLFFIMKLVQLYTNIEFDDSELVDAYDVLNKNMILDELLGQMQDNGDSTTPMISWLELREFKSIMDMVMDDLYENEKSISTILGSIKDAVGIVFRTMLEAAEKSAEEDVANVELDG